MTSLGVEMRRARKQSDELFELVRPRALYERPIPERHRIIFYLGHLEAFDWNQIARGALGIDSFHPSFDRLFEFGIDPPPGQAPQDRPSDWPSVDEVHTYNHAVRERIDGLLPRAPEQIVHVALEHRLMHVETLAYILHNLPLDQKIAPERPKAVPARQNRARPMIGIPAGPATLGMHRDESFGWDNEFEAHTVDVPAFAIGKYKVTNGEYLDFVRAGGSPSHFWIQREAQWFYRGMFGEIPLPMDWPVYVTHEQATEYAKWVGKSLPTEAQFHRALGSHHSGSQGNFNFRSWDPVSVLEPDGDNGYGVSQLIGNGWEWTSSLFRPFPGFEPFPFYPGYSANFFDDEHYVLKGASPRTAASLTRLSYRNWFRFNYPYVYSGFRCVEN
jgi:iron(II)-dependent oxidoreductase